MFIFIKKIDLLFYIKQIFINLMAQLEQQKELIKNVSDMITNQKEKLDEMFCEFIKKMTIENPIINNYNHIDKLLIDSNSDAKKFYDDFFENDIDILYWYDMNEKKFINKIHKYNAKIIKKYEFDIYLEENLFHDMPVKNLINIPMKEMFSYCACKNCTTYNNKYKIFSFDYYNCTHFDRTNKYEHIYIGPLSCLSNSNNPRANVIKNEDRIPNLILTLYLDVNLNIIIPEINTIIINNYVPFSIYGLYSIKHIINKSNDIILNKYSTDNEYYNNIEKVKQGFNNYTNSVHQRDLFNDGTLFTHILDFIEYNDVIKSIEPHLMFQNSLKLDKSHEVEDKYIIEIAKLERTYEDKIIKLETERDAIYKKYTQDVNLIELDEIVDNYTKGYYKN